MVVIKKWKCISLQVLAILILTSCSYKRIKTEPTTKEIKDTVKIFNDFLKEKRKGFDMGLLAINSGESPVYIRTEDFFCGKGEVAGAVEKVSEIKGPFLIIKKPTSFYVVCKVNTKAPGEYFIGFKKVFKGKDSNGGPDIEIATDFKFEPKTN